MGLFGNKSIEYVCRCCKVTENEIIDAVKSGADSFEKIKEATGAATRMCKGRRCKDKIEEIIKNTTI